MKNIDYPVSVYLFGGEGTGWALDADLETTRQSLSALSSLVTLTSLEKAEVIHSVWEHPLLHLDPSMLHGKRIVCHICNDLMRTFEDPAMVAAGETLGLWVAISKNARDQINQLGFKTDYIPYTVDTSIFRPLEPFRRKELLAEFEIPENTFVISSFMRDSDGGDLSKPKEQKGVEAFVAIAKELKLRGTAVHYLLAGPRRHWLRAQLTHSGIPFTFVGEVVEKDDNKINILSAEKINELYQASHLHLVTSRWEGGPRAVLEAAANKTPVLSTPVGLAPDVLEPRCLFSAVDEAVEKIVELVDGGTINYPLQDNYHRIKESYNPQANSVRFGKLYENVQEIARFDKQSTRWERSKKAWVPVQRTFGQRVKERLRLFQRKNISTGLSISLWHEYHNPPYGGGNQFMLALRKALEACGVRVAVNNAGPDIDVHICNSAWFDTEKFESLSKKFPLRMIHRIDGPVTLYRGEGSAEDDKIFALNEQFASATVFQSAFSYMQSCELGYRPVSPMIIHNAVDHEIFHDHGRRMFGNDRKIRLISTAWSDNPRKGGPFYKWLDDNLDFERFEYTFVGRVKQQFNNITHIQPQASSDLASTLRDHDIYITASLHEPCSNALLEALACGLPALYRNGGGSRELVEFGGLPFNDEHDICSKLDRLVANYASFKSSIYIKPMEVISMKYLQLARKIAIYHC